MNILMMTNVYMPHVGGVARSVDTFARELRALGHTVMIICPTYEGDSEMDDPNVIRIPSVQNILNSPFSMPLPIPAFAQDAIEEFQPDIVHSHHPFFLGVTALRTAAQLSIPIVYTRHTRYENYGHYVNATSNTMSTLLENVTDNYSALCDGVIVPSESIEKMMKDARIDTQTVVIPTGIDIDRLSKGNGSTFRKKYQIPRDAFVIGHIGRLAAEKNLPFLTQALATFSIYNPGAHIVIGGDGPEKDAIAAAFAKTGRSDRLHVAGSVSGSELADAYCAMDVFAFSSKSETQGLVVTEAFGCGVPVVALDASGVRDIVHDQQNGYLIKEETIAAFVEGLERIEQLSDDQYDAFSKKARATAQKLSSDRSAIKLANFYGMILNRHARTAEKEQSQWTSLLDQLQQEWNIMGGLVTAARDAFLNRADEDD